MQLGKKTMIFIHWKQWGFHSTFRFNNGNPYNSYHIGPLRIDRFYKYIGY